MAEKPQTQRILSGAPSAAGFPSAISDLPSSNSSLLASAATEKRVETKQRVAVIFYRIGPYHYARLRAGAQLAEVTAIELSNLDPTYAWDEVVGDEGFRRVTVFRDASVESQSAGQICSRMAEVLEEAQPEVVAIAGWYDRCSLAALRWCLGRGVPVVLMSETTAWDESRRWWKEAIKRVVVRLCAAGLVGGRSHLDYLAQLGMPRNRIFLGYDAVDNDYFAERSAEVQSPKSEIRGRLGLPEKYFLASARFVEKKNLPRLIAAYARYRQLWAESQSEIRNPKSEIRNSLVPWSLVLLGDGPLRKDLEAQVAARQLQPDVYLPGFKQYPELPNYYGLASAFIHASTVEQWGLVVNEAMAAGLPVLVSNRCGCAADLIEDGRNGFQFDPYDTELLARRMQELSRRQPSDLEALGIGSKEIVAKFGADAFGSGLHGAAVAALQARSPRQVRFRRWMLLGIMWAVKQWVDRAAPSAKTQTPVQVEPATAALDYICFRFGRRNVLAIPRQPRALHQAAMRRFQPFTSKRRAYRTLLNVGMSLGRPEWFGALRSNPVPATEEFDYRGWLAEMQARLGQGLYGVLAWPSEPKRRRLYVHLLGYDLKAVAFAKILLSSDDQRYFDSAGETYRELGSRSFRQIHIPRLLEQGRFGKANYLVLEPIPEEARPLRLQRSADVRPIIAEYAGPPRRLSREALTGLDWWQRYTERLSVEHKAFHNELITLLLDGALVWRVHGDFGLSNIVAAGSCWWIFDWEMSHLQAPVMTDEVGFFMSFTVGKAPRAPYPHLVSFRDYFLRGASPELRLDVMLALAYRHACGIPDAGAFMRKWSSW
jgi:glycosyltransferase involved in cell wall biosynthesis